MVSFTTKLAAVQRCHIFNRFSCQRAVFEVSERKLRQRTEGRAHPLPPGDLCCPCFSACPCQARASCPALFPQNSSDKPDFQVMQPLLKCQNTPGKLVLGWRTDAEAEPMQGWSGWGSGADCTLQKQPWQFLLGSGLQLTPCWGDEWEAWISGCAFPPLPSQGAVSSHLRWEPKKMFLPCVLT